jgi:hypothetical protein
MDKTLPFLSLTLSLKKQKNKNTHKNKKTIHHNLCKARAVAWVVCSFCTIGADG